MSRSRCLCVLSFLVVVCAGPAASAGLVTWEFGGVITSIDDPTGVVTGVVDVGSPFSGSFTFDPSTPDTLPDSLTLGSYDGAISDLSGEINGLVFSGSGSFNVIFILDHPVDGDAFDIDAVDLLTPSLSGTSDLSFILADSSGTIFDDDSLPTVPPSFDSSFFRLLNGPDNLIIDGEITSVVPEPGTLALLLAGIGLALRRRRRRQKKVSGRIFPSRRGLIGFVHGTGHFA